MSAPGAPDSTLRGVSGSMAGSSQTSLSATLSSPQTGAPKPNHNHMHPHRQSFAENQRHPPPSPRSQRHPSFTQQAIQDLVNHPPPNRHPNPRYSGRDWRDVALGELAVPEDVRWASMDDSVQSATFTLIKNNPTNVVLVRESPESRTAVTTFDYNDLNAYLLVVVGLAKPEDEDVGLYTEISRKAQAQEDIALHQIQSLCQKEELVVLPAEATLDKAVESFGGGVHRILIVNQAGDVIGVLTQLRLVEFFWNEAVNFPVIDRLYGSLLRDLGIGTHQIIAINIDAPLADALLLMHNEGLTSVAVVDQGLNVVGNISTADVRHLTSAASLPLLKDTCMHFISVILHERGVEHGRDSFPVFHVNPYSTLGHTVAKLVATKSHRMWVVESASPSPSAPATPLLQPSNPAATTAAAPPPTSGGTGGGTTSPPPTVIIPPLSSSSTPQSPLPGQNFAGVPGGMPGARLSGRLTGVVSMTDILNLFARSSGLRPSDPSEQRARRRRSSSASVRPSIDSARASVDFRR